MEVEEPDAELSDDAVNAVILEYTTGVVAGDDSED
jgi:hypothetical protein